MFIYLFFFFFGFVLCLCFPHHLDSLLKAARLYTRHIISSMFDDMIAKRAGEFCVRCYFISSCFSNKVEEEEEKKKFHKIVFCVVLMAFSFWLIWWWVFLSNFNLIAWQLLLSLSNKMFMSMYVLIYSHVDNNSFNFSLELLFTKTKCQKRVIWYESCLSVSTTNTELKSETDRKSKREKKILPICARRALVECLCHLKKISKARTKKREGEKMKLKFLNRCAHSFVFPGTQYCVCVVFHQVGGSFSIILLFLFNLYTFHFIQIHSGLRFHTPDLFIVFIFVNEMLSNNAIRLHTHTVVHCLWVFFSTCRDQSICIHTTVKWKKKMFNNRTTYAINNNACGSNFFFSLLFLSLHWTIWCGNNLESMVFIT